MAALDRLLLALQRRLRSWALLYRLTLGTRVLLAAGFVPTGAVKLLGHRFTEAGTETRVGELFDVLYRSGPYWRFLGLAQVLAGLLVLAPAGAALGALLFFGIMLNIFVITVAFDFGATAVVTGSMLVATLYLLLWDYDRWRGLLGVPVGTAAAGMPQPRLGGPVERAAYVVGAVSGIALFTGLRGLLVPPQWVAGLAAAAALSALVALGCGLFRRAGPAG